MLENPSQPPAEPDSHLDKSEEYLVEAWWMSLQGVRVIGSVVFSASAIIAIAWAFVQAFR